MKGRVNVKNEYIVPTGRIIKEYLEENKISQKELCARLGMSEKHISNLVNGKTRVTEELALNLEFVLPSVPASYWLNYESKYREYLARIEKENELSQTNLEEIAQRFKFKEVFDGLGLSLLEQAKEMLKLLKISNFKNFESAYSNLSIEFMEDGGTLESIAVWLSLCESEIEVQNSDISDVPYSSHLLKESLQKFKIIANNPSVELSIKSCRKLCNKLGIYLVLCESIRNSKVRGALTTYDNHPAIYLSGRFKTHDNIWFAFIHEIAHLLKDYDKNDVIISYEESEYIMSEKETIANNFARDYFINPEAFAEFVSNLSFSDANIRQFAQTQGVLPGIVVSRLEHDKYIDYKSFNHLKDSLS